MFEYAIMNTKTLYKMIRENEKHTLNFKELAKPYYYKGGRVWVDNNMEDGFVLLKCFDGEKQIDKIF